MYKIISLFLFFAVQAVHSEQTTMIVSSDTYKESKLPLSFPQIFLFENNGKLIHRKIGWERGLKQVFKNTLDIENAKDEKEKLLSILDEPLKFSDFDFTLVFITDINEKDYCPPCVTQSKINKTVIKSLKNKTVHLVTLRKEVLGHRTGKVQ